MPGSVCFPAPSVCSGSADFQRKWSDEEPGLPPPALGLLLVLLTATTAPHLPHDGLLFFYGLTSLQRELRKTAFSFPPACSPDVVDTELPPLGAGEGGL